MSGDSRFSILVPVIRQKLTENNRCLYLNSPPMVAGLRLISLRRGVDVPKEGLEEVEIRRGCDCLGRLTGRDVWKKISFPLEESAIV